MEKITVKEVEYIAFRLAQEILSFDEPIPDFSTRFPNILESCLATPFQSFFQKSLYPTLISKASILFYLMIKNHPFQNLPAPQKGTYVVYVLKCADGSMYIGQTNDLERRISEHKKGLNVWTKSRLPIQLVYLEPFNSREEAVNREKKLKTGFGRKWLKKQIDLLASRQAGGNKRIAMTTLFVFLYKNKKWLKVDTQELYNFTVWIAQSPPKFKEETVKAIEKFLKSYLVALET